MVYELSESSLEDVLTWRALLLKCNTVKQYCPYYNSRWVSFSVKREGMREKWIRNEEKNKNKREGEIETANEIKWKMVFVQEAFICVCIGPNYAFASIQFFVGLAWSVCVFHCSAWMWLCLHWIIWYEPYWVCISFLHFLKLTHKYVCALIFMLG